MTKKKLLTPLFIAASFLLVACSSSTITGRPSWINDDIIDVDGIKDNKMKEIYDAIKNLGDTNANVLNKIMYEVAQKQIGSFLDTKDKDGNKIIGLHSIANNKASESEIKKFIEDHPIYKSEDKGFVTGQDEPVDLNEIQKYHVSLAKIIDQYNEIIDSIFEQLYNEVKGGEYCSLPDKKLFQEQYFVDHLFEQMYYPDATGIDLTENYVILPKPTNINSDTPWRDYVNNFLHVIDNSTGEFTNIYFPHTDDEPDGGYIGRKLLPDIYRNLLIEIYVREQRYTNLGRSYARKIKMVSIPHNSDYDGKILNTLNYFSKYITGDDGKSPISPKYNLDSLTDAMVGFAYPTTTSERMAEAYNLLTVGDSDADHNFKRIQVQTTGTTKKPLLWRLKTDDNGNAVDTPTDGEISYVYEGTKLGDLIKKYLLTQDVSASVEAPTTPEQFVFTTKDHFNSDALAAYNDITNNGAYDLETGLTIKEREIRLTDMTTDGWFLKSTGVSGLDSKFSQNLFNIKTSNIIDDEDYIKSTTIKVNDTARYYGDINNLSDRIAFLCDDDGSIVLNDKTANFYIVQIEEASSSSKLSTEDYIRSYLKIHASTNPESSNIEMNRLVCSVVKQVASGDTYKKNAEQYYLMISNILFYDQSVYDYFKSQFPDLFK